MNQEAWTSPEGKTLRGPLECMQSITDWRVAMWHRTVGERTVVSLKGKGSFVLDSSQDSPWSPKNHRAQLVRAGVGALQGLSQMWLMGCLLWCADINGTQPKGSQALCLSFKCHIPDGETLIKSVNTDVCPGFNNLWSGRRDLCMCVHVPVFRCRCVCVSRPEDNLLCHSWGILTTLFCFLMCVCVFVWWCACYQDTSVDYVKTVDYMNISEMRQWGSLGQNKQ